MAELLKDYLRKVASEKFVWGVSDCATMGLGWATILTGKAPVLKKPLSKSERAHAMRIRRRPLLEECSEVFEGMGLKRVHRSLEPGMIGLVYNGENEAIAIRANGKWVGRAPAGIWFASDSELLITAVWYI